MTGHEAAVGLLILWRLLATRLVFSRHVGSSNLRPRCKEVEKNVESGWKIGNLLVIRKIEAVRKPLETFTVGIDCTKEEA